MPNIDMSEKLNILFLDFDGVLVSERNARKDLPREDEFGPLFDEECVQLLRDCHLDLHHVQVVITSTWRYQGLDAMQQMWVQRNMPLPLLDITPLHVADEALLNGADSATCRAIEIRAWLDAHPEVYKFAILDDESISDPRLVEHLIQTNPSIGLSEHAWKLCNIFARTPYLGLPCRNFLGDYSLEGLVQHIHDGLLYSNNANIPNLTDFTPEEEMGYLMENVSRLAAQGKQQLALCYGLSMIITFQASKFCFWQRHHELLGLLCQIAIDLREKELAKMILRIADGMVDLNDEDLDNDYNALVWAIDEIPEAEAVDNRLLYFEIMCELRRHWAYSEEERFYAFDECCQYGYSSPWDCGMFFEIDHEEFCQKRAAEKYDAPIIDGSLHSLDEILTMLNVYKGEVAHVYLDNIQQIRSTTSIPTKLALREAAYANKLLIIAYLEAKNQE